MLREIYKASTPSPERPLRPATALRSPGSIVSSAPVGGPTETEPTKAISVEC